MAMDELEISKIVGAGCAALLAYVGFGQLGSAVVGVDQLDQPAYVIEIADAGGDAAVEEEMDLPIGQLMAMAVVDDGPKVFRKCSACHKAAADGGNGVGPNLYGVVGRDIGGVDGYAYSSALMEKDGPWDFAALDGFLEAPKDWAPGTKMGFAGLSKPEDRASVIAWLNEQSAAPLPMPAIEAAMATETVVAEAEPEATEAPAQEVVAEAAEVEAEAPAETVVAEAAPEVTEAPAEEVVAEAAEVEAEAPAETVVAEAAPEVTEAPAEEVVAEATEVEAEAPAETVVAEAAPEAPAETVAAAAPAAPAAAVATAAAFMIGADSAKGAKVFRKCKACHKVKADAGNGVGPNLYGVLGRDIASLDGFKYSDALMGKDGAWDYESMAAFLTKPKDWAPGTKMAYPGLRKEQDRADVIAYLNENSDAPLPMPE